MIKPLFGDITDGRLARLPYFGYSVLLLLLFFVLGIAVAVAIGAAEQLVGGDLQQAQDMLAERFGIPAVLLIAAAMLVLLFAHANLMAKRLRDIGLPGWLLVLAFCVLSGIISQLVSPDAGSGLGLLVWVLLLLVPGSTAGRGPS